MTDPYRINLYDFMSPDQQAAVEAGQQIAGLGAAFNEASRACPTNSFVWAPAAKGQKYIFDDTLDLCDTVRGGQAKGIAGLGGKAQFQWSGISGNYPNACIWAEGSNYNGLVLRDVSLDFNRVQASAGIGIYSGQYVLIDYCEMMNSSADAVSLQPTGPDAWIANLKMRDSSVTNSGAQPFHFTLGDNCFIQDVKFGDCQVAGWSQATPNCPAILYDGSIIGGKTKMSGHCWDKIHFDARYTGASKPSVDLVHLNGPYTESFHMRQINAENTGGASMSGGVVLNNISSQLGNDFDLVLGNSGGGMCDQGLTRSLGISGFDAHFNQRYDRGAMCGGTGYADVNINPGPNASGFPVQIGLPNSPYPCGGTARYKVFVSNLPYPSGTWQSFWEATLTYQYNQAGSGDQETSCRVIESDVQMVAIGAPSVNDGVLTLPVTTSSNYGQGGAIGMTRITVQQIGGCS